MDIAEDKNIRETRYLASQQSKKKGKKMDLSVNPKFSQNYTNPSSSTQETSTTIDYANVKCTFKRKIKDTILAFKNTN